MNNINMRKNNRSRKNKKTSTKNRENRVQAINQDNISHTPLQLLSDNVLNRRWVRYTNVFQCTTSGTLYKYAAGIAQGTASDTRVGDCIKLSHLDFRLSIRAGDATNIVRYGWIYIHGDPRGTTVLGDFLDVGPSTTPDIYSMYYPYLKGLRYTVLLDNTVSVVINGNTSVLHREGRIPINKHVTYIYSTTTAISGDILFFAISDSGVVTHPQIDLDTKLYFSCLL
jgi:hypothetical protein